MSNTTNKRRVILVNNLPTDLRKCGVEDAILECLKNGTPLPEEIADVFVLRVVVDTPEEVRGVVDFA